MSRTQLSGLGAGIGQTPQGAVTANAAGTIKYTGGDVPVPIYADPTSSTVLGTGAFVTDSAGRIPGWVDFGAEVDITIPPAPTVTVPLPARLTAVPVTEDYTASPGDLVIVDATAGDVTVTLPTAPADGTPVSVQVIARGIDPTTLQLAQIMIQPGGDDTFRPGDPYYLTDLFAPASFLYAASAVVWDVTTVSQSKAGLDAEYVSYNNPGPVTGPLTADSIGTNGVAGIVSPITDWGWTPGVTGPPGLPGPWPDETWHSGDRITDQTGAVLLNNQGVWVGGGGGSTPPPAIVTEAATLIAQTTATLNGTIDPNNQATTYQFEYGTTTAYGSTSPGSPGTVGSDTNVYPLSANITGLTANTAYHFRLNAIVGATTIHGADQTFTTLVSSPAPSVSGMALLTSTATTATVAANVNANGAVATYQFQLGTTTAYGTNVPSSATTISPTDNAQHPESANFTGLTANTLYHWRIQAINANGTANSADQTFTTPAGGAPVPVTPPVIT